MFTTHLKWLKVSFFRKMSKILDILWDNFYKNIAENTTGIIVLRVSIIYSLHINTLETVCMYVYGKVISLQIYEFKYISGGY